MDILTFPNGHHSQGNVIICENFTREELLEEVHKCYETIEDLQMFNEQLRSYLDKLITRILDICPDVFHLKWTIFNRLFCWNSPCECSYCDKQEMLLSFYFLWFESTIWENTKPKNRRKRVGNKCYPDFSQMFNCHLVHLSIYMCVYTRIVSPNLSASPSVNFFQCLIDFSCFTNNEMLLVNNWSCMNLLFDREKKKRYCDLNWIFVNSKYCLVRFTKPQSIVPFFLSLSRKKGRKRRIYVEFLTVLTRLT